MRTKKPHQKFVHIAIHPETKTELDELGKKNTSYDKIISDLIILKKSQKEDQK